MGNVHFLNSVKLCDTTQNLMQPKTREFLMSQEQLETGLIGGVDKMEIIDIL